MSRIHVCAAAAALCLSSAIACAQTQPVTIRFAADFGGKPFACSQKFEGVGVTKSTVTPTDFRLYVSEIELVRADGSVAPLTLDQDGKWQHGSVALLDFENGAGPCANGTPDMRDVVSGTAPAGAYKGLRFKVGVPFDLNHKDPTLAPSPLNLTAMFWTWQGGYKFIRIDMSTSGQPMKGEMAGAHEGPASGMKPGGAKPVAAPTPAGFSIHLGSTVCQSSSRTTAPTACQNGNRMEIAFGAFDPAKNVVVFDPAPVLAATNVDVNTAGTSPGCMAFLKDPECDTVMPKLGFAYGGHPAEPQVFVRMR